MEQQKKVVSGSKSAPLEERLPQAGRQARRAALRDAGRPAEREAVAVGPPEAVRVQQLPHERHVLARHAVERRGARADLRALYPQSFAETIRDCLAIRITFCAYKYM